MATTVFSICSRAHRASYGDDRGRVSIFWDLDNKPPKSAPYEAALSLRKAAAQFGEVAEMLAYANNHAFHHIPRWVIGPLPNPNPNNSLVCPFCGLPFTNRSLLKSHRKSFHKHETINKSGYGLGLELRKAGFSVRVVDHSPQAADRALKRRIKYSIDNNGIQCICLVSDDSDFVDVLKTARSKQLRTVVVGDTASLQQFADVWYSWDDFSQGNVSPPLTGNVVGTVECADNPLRKLRHKHDKFRGFYDFSSSDEEVEGTYNLFSDEDIDLSKS